MKMNSLPNNWQVKSLGEVAKFINGRAFKPEEWGNKGLPIIRIQNLTGFSDVFNYYDGDFEKKYLVKKNDILISWSASLGVYVWDKDVAVLNQHIFKVELGDNFDRVFFYYLIKTKIDEIVSHVHGSTMKHITKDRFDNIKVKLPPLSIQKQIAEILEKADRAKQKRKEANKLTDEFLQSVFIEMFGDPVKNPKGWEVQELNQMAEIERDSVTSKNFLTSDLYIGLEHIEKDSGRLLGYESVDKIELKSNKFRFTSDHILYGKLRPYLNKVFLPKFNGVCSTDIIPIKPRKNISNKYFLTYLMRMDFFVKEATTKSTGANLPRISPHLLGKIKLYTPPLSLQQQFTEIVNKTESLKEKQKQSEQELENLFHSLMQKAFKGELVA